MVLLQAWVNKVAGLRNFYLKSSLRTPKASASLRVVRGEAIRRSSSKSETEAAETPPLAESCRTDTPRPPRTSSGRAAAA